MTHSTDDLHADLSSALERTLDYVTAHVPFYRERIPKGGDLAAFPLIDRTVVQQHFFEFLVLRRFPDFIVMSGGTAGDVINTTIRNEEEYDAVHEFLTGKAPGHVPGIDEVDSFGIDIYYNTTGYARRTAGGWPLVCLPLERQAHVDLITRLLVDGIELPGRVIPARHLQSQNALHRVLAGYYAVTNLAPGSLNLTSVLGYGSHLSRVWRERLRALWGREVTTSYGMSEFAGANAATCTACGALHYVTAWQEFLSPCDLSPVEDGDAVLVLTSLVPFVTVQPRVRYVTHDLVTIQGRCPATGLIGFRFRGRESSSVWERNDGHTRVLLSEVDVLEALDQIPDVHVRRHPSEIQLWEDRDLPRPPFRMGLPQFSVDGGSFAKDRKIRLQVELTFSPADDPARARSFEKRFIDLLRAEMPPLADRADGGEAELVVDLVSPGGLRLSPKTSA